MDDITEINKIVSSNDLKTFSACSGCRCSCRCSGWVPGWATRYGIQAGNQSGHVVF